MKTKLAPLSNPTCQAQASRQPCFTRQRFRCRLSAAWLLPLLLLAMPAVLEAQYIYTTNSDSTITITGYTGPGGAVTIPSTINGLPVSIIGDYAFAWSSLTSVTIPNSVTNLGNGAFADCIGLTDIAVNSFNTTYSSLDGVLLNKNQDTLITYPAGKVGGYSVPNTVTSIGNGAFLDCTGLASVGIPNNVMTIGDGSFDGCIGLTSANIGNGVTIIGARAFAACTGLATVTIPSSVTNIVTNFYTRGSSSQSLRFHGTFADCFGVTNITVDPLNPAYSSLDGVLFNKSQDTLIAFPGAKVGAYTAPDSLTSIRGAPFARCTGLASVAIPNSVAEIGAYAFFGCAGLTNVITFGDNVASPGVSAGIGEFAFLLCADLTSLAIPNSVTSIGDRAFEATPMTSITVPKSVLTLRDEAFFNWNGLSVFFEGNAPAVVDGGWLDLMDTVTLYYLPGTTGWGSTLADRPAVLWNPLIQVGDADFGVRAHGFGFNITGTTNIPIVVETFTNLATGAWVPLQTSTLTNGLVSFSDPEWTNYPVRFYRIRWP